MTRTALPTLAVLLLAGCASPPPTVPVPYSRYGADAPPVMLVETHATPMTGEDIPESERRAWFDAQRPIPPEQDESQPQVVERIVERPVCHESSHSAPWWWFPLAFSFGYSSGGGHHGGGWNWGVSSYWPWYH